MSRLLRFRRLPPAERRRRASALLLLAGIRLLLALVPFRLLSGRVRSLCERPSGGEASDPAEAARVGRAVAAAARRVPGATCLTQALAAAVLLRRRGLAARLRIGVTRGARGDLLAHAWVESDGQVVIGGDVRAYAPLEQAEDVAAPTPHERRPLPRGTLLTRLISAIAPTRLPGAVDRGGQHSTPRGGDTGGA